MTDWTSTITGRTSDAEAVGNFSELYCGHARRGSLFASVQREIHGYMHDVGVAEPLLRPLLVLMLVEKALERVARLRRIGSIVATKVEPGRYHETETSRHKDVQPHHAACPREGNRFVSFIGALARLRQGDCRQDAIAAARVVTDDDVTVAVATMNRPEALSQCINAVLTASRWPGELLIVDQSDSDATAQLVAKARWQDFLPVKYIKQQRRGLAASRNAAVSHASRSIVAFTDDDCVPDAQWVTAIVDAFNAAERPDVVTGRVLPLGPEQPDRYAVSVRASTVTAIYRGRALPWSVGSGGNVAARREWLERIGAFDERLGAGSAGQSAEDMDLFYRLLRQGATVRYDPKAVVYHERKNAEGRLASRPAYGFGMGAFCALSLRRADPFAIWILTRWCYDRARALAGACLKRRWRRAHEECLMLRGAVEGVGHMIRQTEGS
jgi:GT2 family glycosyltransferase